MRQEKITQLGASCYVLLTNLINYLNNQIKEGHVVYMREKENYAMIWQKNKKERDHLED